MGNTYYTNFVRNRTEQRNNETKRERSFGEQMYPVVVAGTCGRNLNVCSIYSGRDGW